MKRMTDTQLMRCPANIEFPEELPVSSRREEIAQAIAEHQVVIVCGETGSGKTTQLPKIVLALGRGRMNGGRLIGHTQPRRIAASSVAKRVAEELKTPLGEVVGFKVRFQDRLAPTASVKLMTDGILLAETQSDPDLKAYDTLIIDEAHERSLNIDFLLGYLKQLLRRRPDLKLIVTSATIDAERFAQHFGSVQQLPGKDGHAVEKVVPAPVIMVSGRLYPVEIRYRPFEESRDYGLNEAIADGVDELWRHPGQGGDILVFLPGEREIREAADHLRKHLAAIGARLGPVDVLPLFARLSPADQDKIFRPHGGRRIVLSTNVAETSLTVPGIRYVIDSGLARVKRYSYRNKVEQLLVEPVSQAAANQRAGRCGRVANGICVRLYGEEDYASRPKFTDPEILRSSLAGVILRMKSLGLGNVDQFPFLEPPSGRAIADGYALLSELGATDDAGDLTPVGRSLARLPLDPRVGRMILEAREREALTEVLVIASAMSVQDVRDRPLEAQQQADEKHRRFDDERSEFMGTVRLWSWLDSLRGQSLFASTSDNAPQAVDHMARRAEAPPRPARSAEAGPGVARGRTVRQGPGHVNGSPEEGAPQRLSHRQQEQRLREQFINPRRVREWRDIHTQLLTVVREQGWRLNSRPATYEQLHLALLSGLLGNIGCKSDDEGWYLGARGIKFWPHPGANLSKKPGRWVMAAELVETTRLFGRGLATIQPEWIERMGAHLLKKQLLDPHWEKKAAEVVAFERATLYGLPIYHNRHVNFGLVDPVQAREIFIRDGLVAGEWDTRLAFFTHNRKMVAQVESLEHKARRQDLLVDDELIFAFYDQLIPAEVVSGRTLESWYRRAAHANEHLLWLTREELMRHEAAGITTDAFPRTVRLGGIDCHVDYLHEPGDTRDGMTVTVPIYALNQVSADRCEWLVPGMLADKVTALIRSLYQRPRSRLMPLAAFTEQFIATHAFGEDSLMEQLLGAVRQKTQLDIKLADFKVEQVSPYLFMNFRIVDEHGRQLGTGRNLAALKAELGGLARNAFQALAALKLRPAEGGAVAGKNPVDPARKGSRADGKGASSAQGQHTSSPSQGASQRHTTWDFGELPELMEIARGGQTLVGFPAVVDHGDHVEIEVFDEPEVAARRHAAGLRRLVALQIKDALKYLERNIPDLARMAMAYMPLGSSDELRDQIIEVALDRAFLGAPLPSDAATFERRVTEGRPRVQLIAQEVARLAHTILDEYVTALRKLKDSHPDKAVAEDVAAQLARLMPKRFMVDTPWGQLEHFPRYLKAIVMRLDKLRTDPARDTQLLGDVRRLEQQYQRRVAERRGAADERLDAYRWMLEELRVGLFAQQLRTPQPVSVKRLEKSWAQMQH